MPCLPNIYSDLLGKKMKEHGTSIYLINTGWSGGPYGVGKRIDINLTRAMIYAALDGSLEKAEYRIDETFHLSVPKTCRGVPDDILEPKNTWKDKDDFNKRTEKLAKEFSNYFDKAYGDKNIDDKVKAECPGK
jgi:phosphoenolpyruvate carboxykinase (ATP)